MNELASLMVTGFFKLYTYRFGVNMNKLMKIGIVLSLIVIGSMGGVYVIIKIKYPTDKIINLAETKLSSIINRKVSVEGAGVSLFPLGIHLSGVKIKHLKSQKFKTKSLMHFEKVQLNIALLKMFTGSVEVGAVQIDDLKVNFEKLKNGKTSFDELGSSKKVDKKAKTANQNSTTTLPFDIDLQRFELKNAAFQFIDHRAKLKVQAFNIDQMASLQANKDLSDIRLLGDLSVPSLKIVDSKNNVKTGRLNFGVSHSLSINLKDEVMAINKLAFSLNTIEVLLNGEVDGFLKPSPKLKLNIKSNKISLANLVKEIPKGLHSEIEKISTKGGFDFDIKINGKVVNGELPNISGKISLNAIEIGHKNVPSKLSEVNAKIELNNDAVKIEKLEFNLAGQKGKIKLDVSQLLKTPKINTLDVSANINLGKIQSLAEKVIVWPEGLNLKGFIGVNVKAKGLVNLEAPEKLKLKGMVKLKDISIKTVALKKSVKISGEVKLNPKIILPKIKVLVAGSDVKVDLKIKDPLAIIFNKKKRAKKTSIDLLVISNNLNIDKVLNPQEDAGAQETTPAAENPDIPDVNFDGIIKLKNTVFKSMKMKNFKLTLKMRNKVIETQMNANLYGGTIQQQSTSNFKNKKNAKIVSKIKLSKVEISGLINDFNNNLKGNSSLEKGMRNLDNSVFGKVSLDMDMKTTGSPISFFDNTQANISSVIKNGKLKNGPLVSSYNSSVNSLSKVGLKQKTKSKSGISFSKLVSKIKLSKGNLFIESMDLSETPLGNLSVKGKVGLDGILNLSFENLLNKNLSQQVLKKPGANFVVPVKNGKALVYMSLSGSIKQPKYSVDFKKMANQAGGISSLKNSVGGYSKSATKKLNNKLNSEKKKLNNRAQKRKNKAKKKLKNNAKQSLNKFL